MRGAARRIAFALAVLATAALQSSNELERHRILGKAYYEQGEYALAVAELEKVAAADGATARDLFNLGMAYLQNGEDARALAALTTARQMDPDLVEVDFGLGVLYKRQLRYPPALDAFERVLARDPDDPCTWLNAGAVLFSMNRIEEAERAFRRVVAMGYPVAQNFYASALFRLATILARRGEREEAQRLFAEFQALREKTPNVALTPSALENGRYGRIEIPVVSARPPRRQAPTPRFGEGVRLAGEGRARSDCPRPVAVLGDVDDDGRIDVLVADPCGPTRLFRRGANAAFADATAEAGLSSSSGARDAVFVDEDNDGRPSLLVLEEDGIAFYRSAGEGRFVEATGEAGLAADAPTEHAAAAAVDVDNDGQLDLFVAGVAAADGPSLRLYRNDGDGTFGDASERAGLAAFREANPRGVGAADFDEDGFADLLVVMDGARAVLLRGRGDGRFVATTVSLGAGPTGRGRARVEPVDLDGDGRIEALVSDENGVAVLAVDADGDGGLEILGIGPDGALALWSRGAEGWSERPVEGLERRTDVLAAADFDGDGRLHLLARETDRALRLAPREASSELHWLRLALRGRRSNRQAAGALVELKAADFYRKLVYPGRPVSVGLGERERIDVVRITWTNGVVQNEIGVAAGALLDLEEAQRQTSSCPFVYVWDGRGFRFLTDVVGRAPLGEILPSGGLVVPNPEDAVRIPPGAMAMREGRYVFQITEELRETAYLDAAELWAVDHPASVELYANERFGPPPFEPFRAYAVVDRRPPRTAVDDAGRDVLAEITAVDGRYTAGGRPHRVAGFAEPHAIVVDPGPGPPDEPLLLLLTGWVYWPSSSSMKAIATDASFAPVGPRLDVRDAAGRWTMAIENVGLPSGIGRTLLVDLTGRFPTRDRAIRIVTSFRVHWDRIAFATPVGASALGRRRLAPAGAELHYRGFSAVRVDPAGRRPEAYDYARRLAEPPWDAAAGLYTRYGDALDLLARADDRLVVMAPGDELTVSFDARRLPALAPGYERTFFLRLTGWAKDQDPNTVHGRTVEPLPYRSRDDDVRADRRATDEETRTRRVPALVPPLAPPWTGRSSEPHR